MSVVSLRVNGATHDVDIDPSTPLLYILRNDLGLRPPVRLRPRAVRRQHRHHRRRRDAFLHHARVGSDR